MFGWNDNLEEGCVPGGRGKKWNIVHIEVLVVSG